MNGTGTRRQFIPEATRLSSRAAFVCALALRRYNTQHLLLGPKAAPEFSLRRRGQSPLLMALGDCMGETLLLLSCGVAFLTGLGLAAVSLFG